MGICCAKNTTGVFSMKYSGHDNIVQVSLMLKEYFDSDSIVNITKDWYNVGEGENLPDYYGNPVKGRADVNFYSTCFYDLAEVIPESVSKPFTRVCRLIETMPGVTRASIVAIGPNSIVPIHIDDENRPAYDNSFHNNVFTGIIVPQGCEVIIDNKLHVPKAHKYIPFDAQIPHSASNPTNEWWVSVLLYIHKTEFK